MNMSYRSFCESLCGKHVSLVGFGVSNRAAVPFLLSCKAVLSVRDEKEIEDCESLQAQGIRVITGPGYLDGLQEEDYILRSPGIRPDLPAFIKAADSGAVLTSETEIFCSLCPCPIYAVTGSDGKTTTTTLISLMLSAEYEKTDRRVWLGGNIGTPLLSKLPEIKKDDFAVLELSSFQLMSMRNFHPYAAVVTNISPNHLNWHLSMDEYIQAKTHIFSAQKAGRLILNDGNDITKSFSHAESDIIRFSSRGKPSGKSLYFENDTVYLSDGATAKPILSKQDICLRGMHNIENYMAAIGAVWGDVSEESIRKVARTFAGVPHRIELILKKDGISYYNSSIDSSPTRTMAALSVFEEPLLVICGGYDKHIPLEPMIPIMMQKARAVFTTGQTGKHITELLTKAGYRQVRYYPSFDDAVLSACKEAKAGESVLLSPAAASFDAFRNFEERGNHFRFLIMKYNHISCDIK